MANLLPVPVAKQNMFDHEARFAALGATALLVFGLVAIIVMMPSYVAVSSTDSATSTDPALAEQAKQDEAAIARAQALIEQFSPAAAPSAKGAAIAAALVLRPRGIRIQSVTYSAGMSGQASTLQLSGTAEANQEIEAYRRLLAAAGPFTSVNIPVTALVGTTRGEFTVTLTGTF
ncbi:hypothetical protein FJY94_02825 [Candidatus Kaiserbacteria bacterium]|nr:hypothetical protein [Candidatus Kaiserbacteria bacterium]